jgi:transposase
MSAERPLHLSWRRTKVMIVLGADIHKRSHTIAAVAAGTGELLDAKTVEVGARGLAAALEWARGLAAERVWALEDCRHVSAALERFVLARGERVVRVATRLMADARRAGRDRGKSDRIAVTRLRWHPETRDYVARKRAEGKTTAEALRCLKRHLARRIWHSLRETGRSRTRRSHPQSLDAMNGRAC